MAPRQDSTDAKQSQNDKIFCHNITQQLNNQDIKFKMDNGVIHIIKKNNQFFAYDLNRNKYFQIIALHFCGRAKYFIPQFSKLI